MKSSKIKIIFPLLLLILLPIVLSFFDKAYNTDNYIVSGRYLKSYGNATFNGNLFINGSLGIFGNFLNISVINYNVTGDLIALGNITANTFFGNFFGINGNINSSAWNRSSNKVFLADSDYYVGIGTKNPTANLDVNGNTYISGNINVTGQIYNNLPHMIGYSTVPISMLADTWYNVTINLSVSHSEGIDFLYNNTINVTEKGSYMVFFETFFLDTGVNPSSSIASRITKNGAEIIGSYSQDTITIQNKDHQINCLFETDLEKGDMLNMQVITSQSTVQLNTNADYAMTKIVAKGTIQKMITR